MQAYRSDVDTPVLVGKNVVVVGGGNVAMDAARTARRFGSKVSVIYRRTKAELPAREEEVENALEEGIDFIFLSNPKEILSNKNGEVISLKCIRMELGEADSSGRRRPIEIPNSDFEIETDMVIMALGTNPNPLIPMTSKALKTDERMRIIVDENNLTKMTGVYAGGDNVTGSATVILAMGAGKTAAEAIDKYLIEK